MASIGDFYQRISRAIRRGTVYDDDIPDYAADAVRELEDMENWKYMWTQDAGTLTIGSNVLTVPTSPTRLKTIRFIHIKDLDGEEFPLIKTMRENVEIIASGRPGAYWMDTPILVRVDALPDLAYNFEMGYFTYSTVPLGDKLRWLEVGQDLLMARTIMKMQPLLRDDKLVQRWAQVAGPRLAALQESEVVREFDGQDNVVIPFSEEVREDRAESGTFT